MKKFLLFTIAFLYSSISSTIFSLSSYQYINQTITKTLHRTHAQIGVLVINTNNRKILYRKNSKQYFTPASLTKLFTATAATLYLKPQFRFKTQLFYNGKISKKTLYGNVYLRFSGDPTLKLEDVASLLNSLWERGIRKIKGHVYLDNTQYNHVTYPPGNIWDNLSYGFASPTTAIIIDENQFVLHFKPSKNSTKTTLTADLPANAASFDNRVKTYTGFKPNCPITIYSNSENHYIIGGCLNRRLGVQRRTLAIRNVAYASSLEVADLLKEDQINYPGLVTFQKTPTSAKLLKTHLSAPLRKIIKTMLKESDNLISNSLLKTIGARYYQTQGTFQNGLKAMQKILGPVTKIDFKKILITDGAGLSRYNKVQPQQMLKLLNAINRNTLLRRTIYPALPIAGIDGTLKNRMRILGKRRRCHAKTGTLTGVSNLAGFIRTRRHGKLMFVIMTDNFVGNLSKMVHLQNRLVTRLALH